MEEQWILDRRRLWELHLAHPKWGRRHLARDIGRSLRWVKKWLRRLCDADLDDDTVWHSRSRARKRSPKQVTKAVEERILAIRDNPPDNLQRTPGPLAILYYLAKDPELQQQQAYIPRSTRTIWQILCQYGRIFHPKPPEHEPEDRPEPHAEWQVDFKDIGTVPPDPDGKQAHMIETFDVVDKGTSILLSAQARADYNAMTAIDAMVYTLQVHGCPDAVRLDRDPRFVGSWTTGGFPSAIIRLLMCLGIQVRICPPHRPDKNPFVERFHRTLEYECIRIHRPKDLPETQARVAVFD